MIYASISDAKSSLSELINRVSHGEDVVISKLGHPVARLIPFDQDVRPRIGGQLKGKISVSDDFDEPSEGMLRLFTGDHA